MNWDTAWPLVQSSIGPMLEGLVKGTIPLTLIAFPVGLAIALAVALMRLSSIPGLATIGRFYVSIIRGTPLLLQLFIIFYGLPEFGVRFEPFPAAAVALSLNVGGYAAEIIRSAIMSIPKGQVEAAQTIGMGYGLTLRRVVLPQAARVAVPPLSNTLISLVKDTALASTIIVTEMLRVAQELAAPTGQYFTLYGVAAVIYWVICLALSFVQTRLETRLDRYVAR
ncbi:MAG: amino acid ABC transporter permease [Nocardioidaceae bacterium]|nr:amino acid ABC transporter permease [Nocardioidaceae bacterium]